MAVTNPNWRERHAATDRTVLDGGDTILDANATLLDGEFVAWSEQSAASVEWAEA